MVGDGVSEPGWHLSRGGKTYGPLSDEEFRLLIENKGLRPDDLIWRPGFEDWRSADSVLVRSSPPPIPNKEPIQQTHSKGRAWTFGLAAIGVTTLVAALYIASPYYTLWRLKRAVETKDSLALESIIDWASIRDQIRSEVLLSSYAHAAATNTDGFGVLGTALGAAMIGPMIDSFVQPAAIIRASNNNPEFARRLKSIDVRSGYFVRPMTFRLDMEGAPLRFGDDPAKLGLILEFQGTGWRVTHVDFPWEELETAIEHAPSTRNPQEYVGSPAWKKELDEKFKPSPEWQRQLEENVRGAITKGAKQ